jgi:hypothetical protein
MKKLLIAAFAIAAIVSCKKTVIESPSDEDFGYLSFNLSSDVEMSVVTKAEQTPEQLALYDVSLYKDSELLWTKKYSELSESQFKIAVGTYRVYAENINESTAAPLGDKGSVRLSGTAENISVSSGVNTPVNLRCFPVNSRVTMAFDDTFSQVFSNPKVTLVGGSRSFDMEWGHEPAKGVYYSAGTELTWELTATLSGDSSTKRYVSKTPVTTQSGKWTQITFSTSSSDGSINVTITADDEMEDDEVSIEIDPFKTDN